MEKCKNIINDVIENFKINRTTNAATWLTLILSLVAMWSLNNEQSNLNIWVVGVLITALVVNFIASATFLAQDEDERRNSDLMTGTQVYAICILVAFVGLYASNKETRTLFKENPAVPAVLLTYLVLLIVSLSQQKNLTTAPGAPKASKAPSTSAAPPPSSEPPVTSEEIPVDGSSKDKTIEEFSAANISTIILLIPYILPLFFLIFASFAPLSVEKDKYFGYKLHFLAVISLLLLTISLFAFSVESFRKTIEALIVNNKEDEINFELQESASEYIIGLFSFFLTVWSIGAIIYIAMIFIDANGITLQAIVVSLFICIICMIPIGITSIPIHFNQRALDYIEENK